MWPLFTLFLVINTDVFKYTEHSRVRKLPLLYGGHNFVDQWTDALTEEQWKSNSAEFSYALRHAVHQLRYGEGKPVNERRNSASCMTVCEKRDVAKCVCVCFSTNVTQIIRSCRPFCRRQLLLPDWLPLILSHTLTSKIPVSWSYSEKTVALKRRRNFLTDWPTNKVISRAAGCSLTGWGLLMYKHVKLCV